MEGGEVEEDEFYVGVGDFGADFGEGCFAAGAVAGGEHDGGSVTGELQGGVVADATVGSGDECSAVVLGGDCGGGPGGHVVRMREFWGRGKGKGLTPIYTDGTDVRGYGVTVIKRIKADKSKTSTTDDRG